MMFGLILACTGEVIHHPPPSDDSGVEGLAITALEPDFGPAAGATFVRIAGSGFTSASEVAVGGVACASLTFLSSVELFCTTPPGAVGDTELVVTEGESSASAAFRFVADEVDTGDTGEPPATIAACTLDSPAAMVVEDENYGERVLTSVTVVGRTEGEGQAPGLEGGVGYGPSGSDPSTWEWWEADYVASLGDADQYDASFFVEGVGNYEYAARFRVDHGSWSYCALPAGGWGQLTATPPTVEEPVDYCHTQWPCSTSVAAGAESDPVYAWIYQGGVTTGAGAGPGVLFEVGVGDDGSDPETDASWSWWPMSYFGDKDGLSPGDLANDEYVGSFDAPPAAGSYDYVTRASADYGLTWTLCDLGGDSCNFGGSSDGYDDPGECLVP